jgi:hypothetical protein
MKNIHVVLVLALGFCLLTAGCSSAPTAEINATNEALKSAQTDDVSTYAPESLKAAEDAMNSALADVQTQEQKFALTRDYKQSAALLKSAKDMAEKAKNDAQVNKAKAKSDAEAAVAALPAIIAEAEGLLAKAPKGKDTKADLEIMKGDLKLAQEASVEAQNSISAERYLDAIAKANTAKDKATVIIEQVKDARQKVGKRS